MLKSLKMSYGLTEVFPLTFVWVFGKWVIDHSA